MFPYFTHLLHRDNVPLLHTLTAQRQRPLTSHTYCTETTFPYFTHLQHTNNVSLLHTQRRRFLTSHTYCTETTSPYFRHLQHTDNVSLLHTQRQRPLTSHTCSAETEVACRGRRPLKKQLQQLNIQWQVASPTDESRLSDV